MFRDPKESGVVIVTLPEDMPANESIELAGAVIIEPDAPSSMHPASIPPQSVARPVPIHLWFM